MRLSDEDLELYLQAVAIFLTPDFNELSAYQRHGLKKNLKGWLLPCLVLLPDNATSEDIRLGVFEDEFYSSSRDFLLNKLRENETFDEHSDEELKRRFSVDEIDEVASHLSYLCSVGMEALEKEIDEELSSPESIDAEFERITKNFH